MQAERRCEKCGQVIPSGEQICPTCGGGGRRLWSISRNVFLLAIFLILIVLFVAATFAVKAYQAKESALAKQWYAWGERDLAAHHAEAALQDFQSALMYSRDDSHIELQLAKALAAAGHLSEARVYLLGLWEDEPGNGTFNLELARLAAESHLPSEAIQYYHNAIYGQWDDDPPRHRRQTRLELAEFLLSIGQDSQAQAELLALTSDLPRAPELQTKLATLLLKTGEYEHAAPIFRQVLRIHPDDNPALEGAGEASFDMGDYRDARRYLTHAKHEGPLSAHAQSLLETAALVLEADPLAPRLSGRERVRRALQAFAQGMKRLDECATARSVSFENGQELPDLQKIHSLALALQPKVQERTLARDSDLLIKVTDMAFDIEKVTDRYCGEPHGLDLALLLLSRIEEGKNE